MALRNGVTEDELNNLATKIFDEITADLYDKIVINYQENINKKSPDRAPKRLFTIPPEVLESIPTIKQMRKLYDNYKLELWQEDIPTDQERKEEDDFIATLLDTSAILYAMNFLAEKGFFKKDIEEYRRILKLIWFHPYARGVRSKNVIGSSGFEHVYLTEKRAKKNMVGLHNWLYLAEAESSGKANYFGYTQIEKLSDKVYLADLVFTFDGIKKLSTMFIGTPPEVEIALYTVSFYVNPGDECTFYVNGKKFKIKTDPWKMGDKDLILNAFPSFWNRLEETPASQVKFRQK